MSAHNFIYSPVVYTTMSTIDERAHEARTLYEHRKITLKEFKQMLDRIDTDAAIIEHNL